MAEAVAALDAGMSRAAKRGATDDEIARIRRACDERLGQLESARRSWWHHWRLLSRYIQPRLGRFVVSRTTANRGTPRNQSIVNEVAMLAANDFTSGMMSGATSPARPWFKLRIGDGSGEPHPDAKAWTDEVENRLNYVLSESNFYRAINQVYDTEGVFGSAAMMIQEDYDDVVRFYPIACGEFYLGTDNRGEVDTLAQKFHMTVSEAVREFGLDQCSEAIQANWRNNQLSQEHIICMMVEPNDDRIPDFPGAKGMPYRQVFWELGQAGNMALRLRGFHERPFVAPRWNVESNDAYGRSPGMDALGGAIQIQVMEKEMAKAIQKVNNPPMIGDTALRNEPASVIPGGVTWVPPGSTVGFKPAYQINPNIEHYIQGIERCEERIRKAFFGDLWGMISEETKDMTAFEVAQRKEEKMMKLGPPLERNQDELHRPCVERTFNIMHRSGLVPPPPDQIRGNHISVEFVSILALAQRSANTVAIERTFSFAGSIAALQPQVMDGLDADAAVVEYSDLIGAPAKILAAPKAIAATRKARDQQARQAQALQTGMAAAQAGESLGKIDVGGGQNAVSRMLNGPAQQAA